MLAVDTATEICGVAVALDGSVKAELILNRGVTHTQSVVSSIEAVLKLMDLDIGAIDIYAVTRGPGSFTGLRIGISTVKGLAFAAGKPMVGISSLEVLAHQAGGDAPLVCPVMDARRNEVYWSLYRQQEGQMTAVMDEKVSAPADVAKKIDAPCFFIGNGVAPYKAKLSGQLTQRALWAAEEINGIRPAVLARLAWQRFLDGQFDDPGGVLPVYLRKSDAELMREQSDKSDTRPS